MQGAIEPSQAYRAFTSEFDEIVDQDDLNGMYRALSALEKAAIEDAMEQFEYSFSKERIALAEEGAELVREIEGAMSIEERADTVVSLLIDHSGSMKGIRMVSALLATEIAIDVLRNTQIANEILGFTTTSWHGGNSRSTWQWAGMPGNPGRLCDLRHIVYGDTSRSGDFPWHLRMAFLPDFLKENVDGEALQWAAGRIGASDWKRRVIIQISDGAPVDDATIASNQSDEMILWRHLEQVQGSLADDGVVLGTLLLGGEDVPEPSIVERADEPIETAKKLLVLLRRTLVDREG